MAVEAITLVTMTPTPQASECTNTKREGDVESDVCRQAKHANNELCRRSGADEELVKSERGWRPFCLCQH